MEIPQINHIREAHERIKPFVHRTPVLTSSYLNSLLGCEIFFKCENFQKVGAFKFRGATNALLSATAEELRNGVATHSSGNHAQALALAAKMLGTKATIIMPNNSPSVKKNAVAGYGADIILCEPTLESRESTLREFVNQSGALFVHPYDNFNIICGQGTAALELIDEVGTLDAVIAPVGGGGLLSGTSIAVKSLLPKAKVYGAEPSGADDAARSMREGSRITQIVPNTVADGLRTTLSELTFSIIRQNVDDIITIDDDKIISSMRLIWERMKIIVEPSSATALAAVIAEKDRLAGSRIGIILSGGNVDLDNLPW
ncbi:MAG: pyridoxal-phosphate dependent enzyme [Ignavibacteria bacterium]|nr:pyridoxal-phosphate dependent enzyme [Ignavibacteria bacterium]